MKKILNKYKTQIIVFFYLAISFILIIFHEPWRDEAQQWLICRDLDIIGIIKQLKYEGHFLLWYLILLPFVKLGFPYITQNIISWAISGAGGILFLKKAPFKFWKRALVLFTPMMLYYFPVISRCYCLLPLAVYLVASTYKSKIDTPIPYLLSLVFLVNIHTFLLAPAGLLLLEYYAVLIKNGNLKKDFKKHILHFTIITILLIASGLPLIQSFFVNKFIDRGLSTTEIILQATIVLPLQASKLIMSFAPFDDSIYVIIMCLMTIFICYTYTVNKKLCLYTIISFMYIFFIGGATIGLSIQKIYVLLAIFILFYWLFCNQFNYTKNTNKFRNILLILLIISVGTGIYHLRLDVFYNYSESKEVANYFNNLNSQNEKEIILVTGNHRDAICSVIPYLENDIKVYDIQFSSFNTFTTWDYHVNNSITAQDVENVYSQFKNTSDLYYIYCPIKTRDLSDLDVVSELISNNKLTLIKKFEDSYYTGEIYWIYKINYN